MSQFDFPRINFHGTALLDTPTANNGNYEPSLTMFDQNESEPFLPPRCYLPPNYTYQPPPGVQILQDNKGMCPAPPPPAHQDTLTISGLLVNPGFNPLDSVQVKVTSSQLSVRLLASGQYKTPNLQAGQDYNIIPSKKSRILQGGTADG